MGHNGLPLLKLPKAEANSKKGWLTFSGQVPPLIGHRFLILLQDRGIRQTDAVREAIEQFLARELDAAA